MLTAITIILFSIIIFPIIFIILLIAFGLSFISKARGRPRFTEQKPKGTIEILPAEKDDVDNKEKKIGKDKFRDL